MRLVALQRLSPGMMLNLNFQLEELGPPILASAKVIWQNNRDNIYYPFAVGLKFTKISSADRERIASYIKTASRENPSNAPKVVR